MSATTAYRQPRSNFAARPQAEDAVEPTYAPSYRSLSMAASPSTTSMNSGGWVTFTYIQFAVALGMAALGVFFLDVPLQVKGYLTMSYVFLVGAVFTLAKTIRDEHENKKLYSRIEDARTEKLLMDVGR
jgi:hypothetical protein